MKNILIIASKELKSYFASPIAYLMMAFFAAHLRLLLLQHDGVLRACAEWKRR